MIIEPPWVEPVMAFTVTCRRIGVFLIYFIALILD